VIQKTNCLTALTDTDNNTDTMTMGTVISIVTFYYAIYSVNTVQSTHVMSDPMTLAIILSCTNVD